MDANVNNPPIMGTPGHNRRSILLLVCGNMIHYYKIGLLSRFQTAFCPGFGTGTRLLSRVAEPGQKVPAVKNFFAHHGIRSQDLLPSA